MARSAKAVFRAQRRAARAARKAIRAERKTERLLRRQARIAQESVVDELENALSLDPLQDPVPEPETIDIPRKPQVDWVACARIWLMDIRSSMA